MKDLISQARELLSKATPLPWIDGSPGCSGTLPDLNAMPFGAALYAKPTNDEIFIAFARNHLPEILDALDFEMQNNFQVSNKFEQQAKAIEVMMDEMRSWGAHGAIIRAQAILSGEGENGQK